MDLLLRKSGGRFAIFAKDYELLHNGSVFCILKFDEWKYAEFMVDGNHYVIRFDSKARWVLEQNGIEVARCVRHASAPKLEFSIDFDDRVWCFKPDRKKLILGHDIWEEKLKIGRITPRINFLWPQIEATFNQAPRLEVAGFAVWLIGIHWGGVAGLLTAARADIGI